MKDLAELNSWHSDWKDTRAIVFGLGVTGFSVADTLAELGATVLVLADKASNERIDTLEVLGVKARVGLQIDELLAEVEQFNPDVVIISPGISPANPFIQHLVSNEVPLWTDIDLAWRVRDKHGFSSQWLCITGTNGKTTVTQMVETMIQSAGIRAVACGNIGLPILDALRDPAAFEVLVVELSSFQLHYTNHIEPMVSAVLNVADDHLDWHGGFAEYAKAKGKIYNNTRICCVYNAEDKTTAELLANSINNDSAQAVGFTKFTPTPNEVGWVEDLLIDRAFVETTQEASEIATLSDLSNIPVVSPHLLSNTAAAAAISLAAGVQAAEIAAALRNFSLDGHRIELVLDKDEVKWVDDSKATNPHAASAALSSFDSVVWIVGGLLKGVDISALVAKYSKVVHTAIVIGVDREPVLEALRAFAPAVKVVEIDHQQQNVMLSAVIAARDSAKPGDVVLLAPAAASMDQFVDYADRGEAFRKAVLKEVN